MGMVAAVPARGGRRQRGTAGGRLRWRHLPHSFMGYDPDNDVTLVVWTNLAPSVDGRDPATTIARALIGKVYAPAP